VSLNYTDKLLLKRYVYVVIVVDRRDALEFVNNKANSEKQFFEHFLFFFSFLPSYTRFETLYEIIDLPEIHDA